MPKEAKPKRTPKSGTKPLPQSRAKLSSFDPKSPYKGHFKQAQARKDDWLAKYPFETPPSVPQLHPIATTSASAPESTPLPPIRMGNFLKLPARGDDGTHGKPWRADDRTYQRFFELKQPYKPYQTRVKKMTAAEKRDAVTKASGPPGAPRWVPDEPPAVAERQANAALAARNGNGASTACVNKDRRLPNPEPDIGAQYSSSRHESRDDSVEGSRNMGLDDSHRRGLTSWGKERPGGPERLGHGA